MNKLVKWLAAPAALLAAAASAETLTVYTALEDDEIAVYRKDWETKNPGVTLSIVRDSTGIITARLLAEKDNPRADVVWGTALTSLLICDEAGMLAGYKPAGFDALKKEMTDTAHAEPRWVGIKAWMTGFVCNTIECARLNLPLPASYAALANPVYKGRLVMPNPASSGTGFLTISAILQLQGEEKGWAYLDKLHANMAQYTHSGSAPARLAGRGEFPIGISFGYRGVIQKQRGEPVKTLFPAEGSGWDLEANALIRKPVIKPAAKKFLDWAVSRDAMTLYSRFYPVIALEMEMPRPDEDYPADPAAQLIKNDFAWAAKNRERILTEWTRRYDGKSEPRK